MGSGIGYPQGSDPSVVVLGRRGLLAIRALQGLRVLRDHRGLLAIRGLLVLLDRLVLVDLVVLLLDRLGLLARLGHLARLGRLALPDPLGLLVVRREAGPGLHQGLLPGCLVPGCCRLLRHSDLVLLVADSVAESAFQLRFVADAAAVRFAC